MSEPRYSAVGQLPGEGAPAGPAWYTVAWAVLLPSLVVFVAVDLVWITLVANSLFQAALGDLMRPTPNPVSGVLAWLAIVGAVYHFASKPSGTAGQAAVQGAILGAALYGTYEFTNHSIISTWTWTMALGDFAWGSFLCSLAAATQHKLLGWAGGRR